MKKIVFILLTLILFMSLPACTGQPKDPKSFKGTLKIWSFTDEVKKMIEKFESVYTAVKVELTVIIPDDYMRRRNLDPESGRIPDIFTAEYANVIDLVESGFYADLGQFRPHMEDIVDYVVDVGTDSSGRLRALSWQATPGGFFYRRSIAKKYLGTDDPEQVGEMLSTEEKFLNTARTLKETSGGRVKFIAGYGDFQKYAWSHRTKPSI